MSDKDFDKPDDGDEVLGEKGSEAFASDPDPQGEPLPVADVVQGHDLEPGLLAEVGERRDVPRVAVPEPGVHPDDDAARSQPSHEDRPDEVLGLLLRELVGEVQDEEPVDPGVLGGVVADLPRPDELGGGVRAQHGGRVGVERDGHRRQPEPVTGLDEGVQHRPVTAVDAVEVAEGDDTGPEGLRCL